MTAFEAGRSVGRYRILRPLGSGAMGVVYLAQDPQIERLLAIKTVRLEAEREEEIEERTRRLLREAKTAGRLIHPHIVTLFDAGEQDGMLFLAFEYVEGRSLADRLAESLRTGPPMRVAEALRIARETAEGLDHAHRRGIVHRDVKPANLLLAADGGIKISDFGIAKMAGQATELTVTGSVVGSPHYLSPEQVRGEELDGRSDLFSLGVVLYEMLGGRRPFDGDTFTTLLYKILHAEPEPIRLRPGLQPDLARLLGALLAKDPAHRPPDGARVAEEIAALERDLPSEVLAGPAIHAESSADREDALPGTRAAPIPPPPPPPPSGPPGGPSAVAPGTAGLTEGAAASGSSPGVSPRARRRRMLWLGAALGLALLAAGVTAG
ncbi:MAG: serine/threonine-protein kinase, partial [Acidobacteriota bacterium]